MFQEEEGEGSVASDRDSDAEFEQMLQEAEEGSKTPEEAGDEEVESGSGDATGQVTAPRRKAKTKIGNKSKKKKKTKTTSKFPGGEGEDGYEVL